MKYRNFWGKLTLPSATIRLVLPPLTFISPFLISFLCVLADLFDSFFYRNAGFTLKRYQLIDKSLDLYWYTFSLIYAYGHLQFFPFLLVLYLFRLVGQIVFFIKKDHEVLLFFPNFFEFFFLLLIFVGKYRDLAYLISPNNLPRTLAILFSAKILEEILLHTKIDGWIYKFLPESWQWPKK